MSNSTLDQLAEQADRMITRLNEPVDHRAWIYGWTNHERMGEKEGDWQPEIDRLLREPKPDPSPAITEER